MSAKTTDLSHSGVLGGGGDIPRPSPITFYNTPMLSHLVESSKRAGIFLELATARNQSAQKKICSLHNNALCSLTRTGIFNIGHPVQDWIDYSGTPAFEVDSTLKQSRDCYLSSSSWSSYHLFHPHNF